MRRGPAAAGEPRQRGGMVGVPRLHHVPRVGVAGGAVRHVYLGGGGGEGRGGRPQLV